MRQQGLSFIQKLIRFLGTRNVRLQSRGLPKGMGQTRKGTIKKVSGARGWTDPMSIPRASQVMGGGRLFTPIGGGKSKFITKGSTYGHTRGAKIGATGAAGGAVLTAAGLYEKKQTPSGVASTGADSVGKRQMQAVRALKSYGSTVKSKSPISKVPAWHGDVASWSKTGYHKFKKGSKSAKAFQQSYAIAKKSGAKVFTWGLTGKKYKV